MDKKYWVPAIEKADLVLRKLAEKPSQLRLIDLSTQLGINKSSMFSLLQTMEALNWVTRDQADTYMLGSIFGLLGNVYLRSHTLIQAFHQEAVVTKEIIGETIQLGRLEGNEILYLAKEEMPSPVRLVSDPGMKLPAHATALGKILMAGMTQEQLEALYPTSLAALTPHTLTELPSLLVALQETNRQGYAVDEQEAVIGFHCVAAPVWNRQGEKIAAVSCSMPLHVWNTKKELAQQEILQLAHRLSQREIDK